MKVVGPKYGTIALLLIGGLYLLVDVVPSHPLEATLTVTTLGLTLALVAGLFLGE